MPKMTCYGGTRALGRRLVAPKAISRALATRGMRGGVLRRRRMQPKKKSMKRHHLARLSFPPILRPLAARAANTIRQHRVESQAVMGGAWSD